MLAEIDSPQYKETLNKAKNCRVTDIARATSLSRPTVTNFLSGKPISIDSFDVIEKYIFSINRTVPKTYDIAQLRLCLGRSQNEVAEFLGISQSTLSRLESVGIPEDSKYYELYQKLAQEITDTDFYLYLEKIASQVGGYAVLARLRSHLRLSQIQFSHRIGLCQPYYCQIESGKKPVTVSRLKLLIKRLNLPKEQIYDILA